MSVNLSKGISLAKRRPSFEFHAIRPDGTIAECPALRGELQRNDLDTLAVLLKFASVTGYHYFTA